MHLGIKNFYSFPDVSKYTAEIENQDAAGKFVMTMQHSKGRGVVPYKPRKVSVFFFFFLTLQYCIGFAI